MIHHDSNRPKKKTRVNLSVMTITSYYRYYCLLLITWYLEYLPLFLLLWGLGPVPCGRRSDLDEKEINIDEIKAILIS